MDGVSGGGDGGGEAERLMTGFITGFITGLAVVCVSAGGGGSATTTTGVSSSSCCNCLRRRRSRAAERAAPGLSGVFGDSPSAANREKIHCEKKSKENTFWLLLRFCNHLQPPSPKKNNT